MDDLGERIRLRREELGLTQVVASERAGMYQGNWSDYERGAKMPTLPVLERIAMVLGVRPGALIDMGYPAEG